MPITYEQILPWGRSYDEYRRMFGLTNRDLERTILGCGDGPAAFNAHMHRNGGHVVSVDPIYHFDRDRIAARIDEVTDDIMEQTRRHADRFRWDLVRDVDELGRVRRAAMKEFLDDYTVGRAEGRYLAAELPELPLASQSFDLTLCSHLLFLYSDHLDLEFHVRAIEEMLRVAAEVRIFPIVDLNALSSTHLPEVLRRFGNRYEVELRTVDYEFQRNANQMLVLRRRLP